MKNGMEEGVIPVGVGIMEQVLELAIGIQLLFRLMLIIFVLSTRPVKQNSLNVKTNLLQKARLKND